jgi:hypothetical protein
VASFATTTSNLELWSVAVSEALGGHIGYNGPPPTPGGETVYLCYFDGDFGSPRGPQASGVPDWSRVVVEIDSNGGIDLLVGGFKESIPVIDPNTTVSPSPTNEAAATSACQLALDHPELDAVVVNSGAPTLAGAFIVTLSQWTGWEERQTGGRNVQPLDHPDKLVAACFIDGDFTAQTSGGQSETERHRTRIVVLVYDGFVEPHMYGTKESIPVEDPATAAAATTSPTAGAMQPPPACEPAAAPVLNEAATSGSKGGSQYQARIRGRTQATLADLSAAGYVADPPSLGARTLQYVNFVATLGQRPGMAAFYLADSAVGANETEADFLGRGGVIVTESPSPAGESIVERVLAAIGDRAGVTQVASSGAAVSRADDVTRGVRPYLVWWSSRGFDWELGAVTADAATAIDLARAWECR